MTLSKTLHLTDCIVIGQIIGNWQLGESIHVSRRKYLGPGTPYRVLWRPDIFVKEDKSARVPPVARAASRTCNYQDM